MSSSCDVVPAVSAAPASVDHPVPSPLTARTPPHRDANSRLEIPAIRDPPSYEILWIMFWRQAKSCEKKQIIERCQAAARSLYPQTAVMRRIWKRRSAETGANCGGG